MTSIFSINKASNAQGDIRTLFSVSIEAPYKDILEGMVIAQHLNPHLNVLFAHAAKIYEKQIAQSVDMEQPKAQA
jgi:hypothetical protein